MKEVKSLYVDSGEEGVRLDRWFKRRWPHLNHIAINKLVRSGQIRVDGARAKVDTRLAAGALVRVPPLPDAPPQGERPAISERDAAYARSLVIYEDEDVLALNKPASLAVQGGTKTTKHVDRLLSAWGEGLERPRLVHRLDRDTSGVLVLGKTPAAAARLSGAFAKRRAKKTYWALVAGEPRPGDGVIELPLVKKGVGDRELVVPADPKEFGAEPAETEYVTISRAGARVSWMGLRPYTGRTHQLRAHLKAIGHPILGDPKYGDEASAALSGGLKLQLHARRIELPHPSRGALILEAPPSPELLAGFDRFGFDQHEADADPFEGRREGRAQAVSRSPRTGLDPRFAAQASAAFAHLQARRYADAVRLLAPLALAAPGEPDLRRAHADALLGLGVLDRAEVEARAAVSADKRRAASWMTLAGVLDAASRTGEAEKALRQAVTLDRRFVPAAVRLNQLLLRQGRTREAVQATAALAAGSSDAALLSTHGQALKAERRFDESLAFCERARDADPANGVGEHNVASLLADLHRHEDALAATDRAFAAGADFAVTWLVRAHAFQGLDRLDEAEMAYAEALKRDPRLAPAATDLARLRWVRTGDAARAVAIYDRALAAGAADPSLRVDKARLLEYAGAPQAALAALGEPDAADALGHVTVGQIAAPTDPDRAVRHAQAAVAARPQDPAFRLNLAEARLAQGRPDLAAALAGETLTAEPHNQSALAIQAAAWRLLDDPRYRELYDYGALVGAYRIETPPGWPDLQAFLADLRTSLTRLHTHQAHPIGQSLRQGTQTGVNLRRLEDPTVKAAFAALDAPIRAHIAGLGKGRDPVRSRIGRGYDYSGAWSVRLKPGGRHVDHVHPEGWLSSAFYVDLPPSVEAGGREGWIKFGEPGLPHGPRRLEAEHWVKPEPGKLVLFPSYMWHGTAPFGGEAPRLTMAFDLVPS